MRSGGGGGGGGRRGGEKGCTNPSPKDVNTNVNISLCMATIVNPSYRKTDMSDQVMSV